MNFIIDNFDKLFNSEESLKRLEEIILDLAVKGKLVPQDPNDSLNEFQKLENQELPLNWKRVKLGEVVKLKNGYAVKSSDYSDKGIPLIRISNIQNGEVSTESAVKVDYKDIYENFMVEKGDLLLTMSGGTTGKMGIYRLDEKALQNQRVGNLKIIDNTKVYDGYRNLFFESSTKKILSLAYGGAQPNISTTLIESLDFPLPPLDEQKRIVEKVDKLKELINQFREKIQKRDKVRQVLKASIMNEIEKSNSNHDLLENLELIFRNFDSVVKTKEDIKDIRDLVLSLAVKGKLVPQDPIDEPANILLEKIKAEKEQLIKDKKIKKDKDLAPITEEEIPFEIPENWQWVRLGEILTKLTDGAHQTPKYTEIGVPFISVKDLSSGIIDFSNTRFISEEEHKELYKRCDPQYGDLLLTKVGTTGIPKVVDTETEFSLFVSVALLKFNKQSLFNYFLEYLIKSPLVQKQVDENTKGVGNKNWVLKAIANTLIILPPLAEQKRIVLQVEKLMKVCDELEKLVEKSQKEANKLMGSLMNELVG